MKVRALAAAMAALLSACGGTPTDPGTSVVATSASPERAASATAVASTAPEATPEPTSLVVASDLYPYALTLAGDWLPRGWQPATTAWDGVSRIDHGNAYTDVVETADGSLFAFGFPMDGGPGELRDLVSQQASEWHGCDLEPTVERPLAAGDVDGIYGTYECGARTVLRWFGVRDGFGLFVGLIVRAGADLDEAAGRFKEHIGELEWTN